MLDFLESVIREAGALTMKYRADLENLDVHNKSPKDLVTEADRAAEDLIWDRIHTAFPDHGMYGEETGNHAGNGERWIVDPIDGTSSFVHGQPFFSVSMAYEKDGVVLCGGVYAPAMNEIFLVEKGKGVTLNGKSIKKSPTKELQNCIMATGFACLRSDLPRNNLPYLCALLPQMRDMRRYGSAALDLAYVACGRLEGFWELNLHLYDIAAGLLMVQEVGGLTSDFSGGPITDCMEVLVTNGEVHDQVIAIFETV